MNRMATEWQRAGYVLKIQPSGLTTTEQGKLNARNEVGTK